MPVLLTEFNESLKLSRFPHSMKSANITPVFKKNDRTDKSNYRPVSILPNLSKVFERCIYKQLSAYFDGILSKQQCGFRKGFNAQHSLLKLLEKWRQSLDQGLVFGVLLTFIGFWLPFPWTIGSKIKCLWSTYLSSSFYLWLFN